MIHADTQRLTRTRLELSSPHERRRQAATFVTVLLMLLLAGAGALYLHDGSVLPFATPGPSAALVQENAALRADLDRVRTELGLEKATRAELNREAGELNARISELTNRLEFLAARAGRPDPPR